MAIEGRGLVLGALAVCAVAGNAFAGNGMVAPGFGPEQQALGGTAMAYDTGAGGITTNPATLALMADGRRLDLGIGFLELNSAATLVLPGPDPTARSKQHGTGFFLGWAGKRGRLSYGVAIAPTGGIGAEYGRDTWLADPSMGVNTALSAGLVNRSEAAVSELDAAFGYDVNDRLSIAVSVGLARATMDLQSAMGEGLFQDLANPAAQTVGTFSGSMAGKLLPLYEPFGGTGIRRLYHTYVDFSDDSDYSGAAKGNGVGAKLGFVYRVTPRLTIGGAYHAPIDFGDLKARSATVSFAANMDPGVLTGSPTGIYTDVNLALTGTAKVRDFRWPAMLSLGAAYRPTDRLLLVGDIKHINWSSVMNDFRLSFTAAATPANGAFAGTGFEAQLFQKWDDQLVFSVGTAYRVTDALTVRGGFSHTNNPVQARFLNVLFPVITEDHLGIGLGYRFSRASSIDVSVNKALNHKQTNPGNGSTIPPVSVTAGQVVWGLLYSYRY